MARLEAEKYQFLDDPEPMLAALRHCGSRIDLFTFMQRLPETSPKYAYPMEWDNLAVLPITTFDRWWNGQIGFKGRNKARQAEKKGVTLREVPFDDALVRGIWEIYNECPIRQGRAFSHYGARLEDVTAGVRASKDSTFIGAYFQNELVGFIQLVHGDDLTIISQILSLQAFWEKAVNNALVAKAIAICAEKQIRWVMYGRMGNHPSLDAFKQSNCFEKFSFPRYYVPITKKGQTGIKLGLQKDLKDALPNWIKGPLFPMVSWISRTKAKAKQKLHTS